MSIRIPVHTSDRTDRHLGKPGCTPGQSEDCKPHCKWRCRDMWLDCKLSDTRNCMDYRRKPDCKVVLSQVRRSWDCRPEREGHTSGCIHLRMCKRCIEGTPGCILRYSLRYMHCHPGRPGCRPAEWPGCMTRCRPHWMGMSPDCTPTDTRKRIYLHRSRDHKLDRSRCPPH